MDIPIYQRFDHVQRFDDALRKARLWRRWHRLLGRPETLLPFGPILASLKQRTGFYRGIKEIPLKQVVGSIDRATDFDREFRPLTDRNRNRWVNIRGLQSGRGWEPIVVHKIGNLYFIEDGHHRVSVARDSGLQAIEAKVIEYPLDHHFNLNDDLKTILRRLRGSDEGSSVETSGQFPLLFCI